MQPLASGADTKLVRCGGLSNPTSGLPGLTGQSRGRERFATVTATMPLDIIKKIALIIK
jgi:hypothetical protein